MMAKRSKPILILIFAVIFAAVIAMVGMGGEGEETLGGIKDC